MRRRRRKNQYIFAPEQPRGRGKSFLLGMLTVLCLIVVGTLLMNFAINHQVVLERQRVTVQNLPGDLENWSILHISDLHGQEIGQGQSAIRQAIEGRSYSCVVFTGDMVGREGNVEPLLDLIALLPADTPKILIPGDSDPALMDPTAHASLSVYAEWAERVQAAGVILLDEPVSFTRNKSTIWFVPEYLYTLDLDSTQSAYQAQLDSLTSQTQILTPDQSAQKRVVEYQLSRLERLRETKKAMKDTDIQVALTHTPLTREYVTTMLDWQGKDEIFSLRHVSLILAGHYVGGQWRFPWGGAVYVPDYGWTPSDSLIMGLDYISGVPQYISPGLAASDYYPQPGRFFNGPTVTLLTLSSRMV